ncbi:MAG: glycosyltransferase [Planctomycetota bacterium]
MPKLRISVVIPVHNSAATLERCLAGLAGSTRSPDEVIIVDDASTDASPQISRTAGSAPLRLEPTPRGPAFARNAAAVQAKGDVLVFVDSDVVLQPDTIDRLVAPIEQDATLAATFGSYDDNPPAPGIASRYANLRHHFIHQQGAGEAATFWAGCGAVRKAAYDAAGGFDIRYDRPAIEDVELGLRLTQAGGRILLVPDAQATHLKDWSLTKLWRTDIFCRALPWARLMASGDAPTTGLNTNRSAKASAMAVAWATLAGLLGVIGLIMAAVAHSTGRLTPVAAALLTSAIFAGGVWLALNARFLALLYRRGGVSLALGGGALHAIYYLYGSAAVAWVGVRARWAGRSLADSLARTICLFALAACSAAAIGYAAFALTDPGYWVDVAATLEGRGSASLFTQHDVLSMQRRALAATALTLATAAGFAALGSGWLAEALRDTWRMIVRTRRLPASHVTLICIACIAFAAMWFGYADQPMRTDEAASAARYADRSPLVAAAYYHDTNNHVAHSLMLSLVGATLGDSERAMRLPALLGVLLSIPMMYAAARRMGGTSAGVLAAAALAGSGYTLDVATNARGYPFVIAATLACIALLPDALRRRHAWLGVAALSALGAWAVPVMLYPVSVLWAWLLLTVIAKPKQRPPRRLAALIGLALATGLYVLLLYLPAIVTANLQDQIVVQIIMTDEAPTTAKMIDRSWSNVWLAWRLWTANWPDSVAVLSLALCVAGWIIAVIRPGRARRLALATIAGPIALWVATRLSPPPWWTLGWLFPLYLTFACLPVARSMHALSRHRTGKIPARIAPGLAGIVLALGLTATLTSAYPDGLPIYSGHRGARAVAAYLDQHAESADIIYSERPVSPVIYYLQRLGVFDVRFADRRETPGEDAQRVFVILLADRDMDPAVFTWTPETAPGWHKTSRIELEDSVVLTYKRHGTD